MIVNLAGGIWLNREELDTQAIRTAVNFLKQGGLLGIAPEGTRSKNGGLLPAKSGVAYLASKSQAKIVPIAITGTENAWSSLMKLRRPKIKIIFGAPFELPPIDRSRRELDLQSNTDEIMCRIAALLPEKYRGVYAGHIRLQELIDLGYPQQNGIES